MHLRKSGEPEVMARPEALSFREQLTLSVLWFGLNFQTAALFPIVVPTQLVLFITPGQVGNVQQATALAWLSAGGAAVAVIVPPIFGALSDHTPGPLGRRRPYILVGTVLLALGAVELATARQIGPFVMGFVVLQFGSGVSTAAYQSLVPDFVPMSQRGAASGFIGMMTILGNVGSLGIAGVLLGSVTAGISGQGAIIHGSYLFYGASAAVLIVTVAVTVFGVREVPLALLEHVKVGGEQPREGWRARLASDWLGPWRHRNFTWVFLTRSFVILGLTIFMTYILYYFAQVASIPNYVQGTTVIALLALLGAVFSAITLGVLSDHIGRVPLVCIASFLMGLAALAFVVAPGAVPLWPLGIVFGLGYGAYSSVDWALSIDALPSLAEAGKDMGLWSISSNLPTIVAPLLGGIVIAIVGAGALALGYRLVFALADLFFLLGAVCIFFVREPMRDRPTRPQEVE
jgi:MFS family permease